LLDIVATYTPKTHMRTALSLPQQAKIITVRLTFFEFTNGNIWAAAEVLSVDQPFIHRKLKLALLKARHHLETKSDVSLR